MCLLEGKPLFFALFYDEINFYNSLVPMQQRVIPIKINKTLLKTTF
jgi:hypothetical protein